MGDVAGGPGAEGDVEPGEGEEAEKRAGYFVEELFEDAPEAAETVLGRGWNALHGRGHVNILAQNRRPAREARAS